MTRKLAVLLPERERLPFGDADLQPVGIELRAPWLRRSRDWLSAAPRATSASRNSSERAAGDPGGGQNVLAADLLLAGERDGSDVEAGGIGRGIAQRPMSWSMISETCPPVTAP